MSTSATQRAARAGTSRGPRPMQLEVM